MRVITRTQDIIELANDTIELYTMLGELPSEYVRSLRLTLQTTQKGLTLLFFRTLLEKDKGREVLKKYFSKDNDTSV